MKQQNTITEKLMNAFSPFHLEVENESHKHSVPENSETHFKVLLVSEKFAGESRVNRQRSVYTVLSEELAGGVHALALRCLTPEELKTSSPETFQSPNCANKK